jgi:hypothetical protein
MGFSQTSLTILSAINHLTMEVKMNKPKEKITDNIKCEVCNKYDATSKDYRFIDQLSLQGSCYLCEWCVPLNDVTLYQISNEKLDPKYTFHDGESDE